MIVSIVGVSGVETEEEVRRPYIRFPIPFPPPQPLIAVGDSIGDVHLINSRVNKVEEYQDCGKYIII